MESDMKSLAQQTSEAAQRIARIGWDVDPHTGCWNWRGEVHRGRAKYNVPMGNRNTVRILWEAERGVPAPGLEICHTCHNPLCVNLDHCYAGTHAQNMSDERGRSYRPGRRRRGPSITPEQEREVRAAYNTGATILEVSIALGLTVDRARSAVQRTGGARKPGRRKGH